MADSEETSAKIQISPDEFRRILSGQFRAEVTDTIWKRVKAFSTLGGTLSVGVLVATATFAINWLSGTVQDRVKVELDTRMPAIQQANAVAAQKAAQEAVQTDIARVDKVRERVTEQLPEMMRQSLDSEAIRQIIREQAEQQTAQQLRDPVWRRGIERSVMTQQAGDTMLPPLVRLFAFTDLLRDTEGEAIAVRLLGESAGRVPAGGLARDLEEARFLGQAVTTYVGHLSRSDPSDRFAAHEALARRLAALLPDPVQPGNPFEALVQRFGHPLTVNFLIRLARESGGTQRQAALQALLTYPQAEARERLEGLLCTSDPRLRADLLQAVSFRPGSLVGDDAGERFTQILRCTEEALAARRVPAVETSCLPGRDLSVPWQLSRLPGAGDRAAGTPLQRSRRAGLERQLTEAADRCPAAEALSRGSAAQLRAPGGWSTLLALPQEGERSVPLLGLAALLPAGEEGAAPRWLADMLEGRGPMAALLEAPERMPAQVSLLLERLSGLPDDMQGVREARLRLAGALARARPTAGRIGERLLLESLAAGGAPLCAAVLRHFAETPPAEVNLAVAESVACLRGTRPLAAEHHRPVLALIALTAGRATPDQDTSRRALAMLATSLNLGNSAERAPAVLISWILELLKRGRPSPAEEPAMADALEALATLGGTAVLADVFETSDQEVLEGFRGQLRNHSIALAPLARRAPYLEPGFPARVSGGTAPLEAGGRFWTTLPVRAPSQFVLEPDTALIVVRSQPLAIETIRTFEGASVTNMLRVGTYLLGASRPEALATLRPRDLPALVEGFSAVTAAEPLAVGGALRGRIGPAGPRLYPYALEADRSYTFATAWLEDRLDTMITLLDPSGQAVAGASNDDSGAGLESGICVRVPAGGVYWLQVESFDRNIPAPRGFELHAGAVETCPEP
ncbi:hypothetical protein VQH23_10240 [Pararoseomonas sp. SCSIO 73927]|uniref:hypothetical protein n=1 Tax=Pararoseomonas sp. SCSIO 73927 TaxID=3114537 RepID=UPI0030D3B51A